MKKTLGLLIMLGGGLAMAAAVVLLFGQLPLRSEGHAPAQDATLANGGFEGEYEAWEGSEERKIAPGWSLWYQVEGSTYPAPWAGADPDTHREGDQSQRFRGQSDSLGYNACLYQQLDGLIEGYYIRFSAWVKADAHPWLDSAEKWRTMVGIDPSGGTNPKDISHYENPDLWDIYTDIGQWQHLSVLMKATSPTATVYACAHPSLPRQLDVRWDEATFTMTPESLVYVPVLAREYCWLAPGTLANPDLEKDYCILKGYQPYPGYSNVFVAPYWHPFWNDDYDPGTNSNKQPEYNYTDRSYRVHSGEVAQQFGLSGGGAFEAGIYQVVRANISDTLRFTIWGMGWTQYWPSPNDPYDEGNSDYTEPGGLRFRVGIDPYGGESYTTTNMIWSDYYDPYDAWHRFEVTATALSDQISVWAYAHPDNPILRWNQTFWDDATLVVIQPVVSLAASTGEIDEGAGAAAITVTLDVPSSQMVSVGYATSDGTAQAPEDYTAISGTLVFTPGHTSRVLLLPISDDALEEEDETLVLTLSEASHATLGVTDSITLTILDND